MKLVLMLYILMQFKIGLIIKTKFKYHLKFINLIKLYHFRIFHLVFCNNPFQNLLKSLFFKQLLEFSNY